MRADELPQNGLRQPRAGGLALARPDWKALERISARKIAPIPASRLHAMLGGGRVPPSLSRFDHAGVEAVWVGSLIAPNIELWYLDAVVGERRRDVRPMGDAMIDHRHKDQACVIVECPTIASFAHLVGC